jgi:hypothetical protein
MSTTTIMQKVLENAVSDDTFMNRYPSYVGRVSIPGKRPRYLARHLSDTRTSVMDIVKWQWQIIQHIHNAYISGVGTVPHIKLHYVKVDHNGDVMYETVVMNPSKFSHGYEAVVTNSIMTISESMLNYGESNGLSNTVMTELKTFCIVSSHMYTAFTRSNPTYTVSAIMTIAHMIYESAVQGMIDDLTE